MKTKLTLVSVNVGLKDFGDEKFHSGTRSIFVQLPVDEKGKTICSMETINNIIRDVPRGQTISIS